MLSLPLLIPPHVSVPVSVDAFGAAAAVTTFLATVGIFSVAQLPTLHSVFQKPLSSSILQL